jgi:hypothetical protein
MANPFFFFMFMSQACFLELKQQTDIILMIPGMNARLIRIIPCVPGIVTQVASLLSQSAFVFWQKYRTEKYLLHLKEMSPHPA